MKTTKDFMEKLKSDPAFAEEVGAKVREKIETGEQDYKAIWIPIAAEYGYELTSEELDNMVNNASTELSEEELGKVAAGTSPTIAVSLLGLATLGSYIIKDAWDETH